MLLVFLLKMMVDQTSSHGLMKTFTLTSQSSSGDTTICNWYEIISKDSDSDLSAIQSSWITLQAELVGSSVTTAKLLVQLLDYNTYQSACCKSRSYGTRYYSKNSVGTGSASFNYVPNNCDAAVHIDDANSTSHSNCIRKCAYRI